MKKIVSNLSVMIFVIGCAIMEITTWFIDSYVMSVSYTHLTLPTT